MITVQAQIGFRVEREADAYRIMLAIADLVMPEIDGSVTSTMTPGVVGSTAGSGGHTIWQHPHMEGR